EEAGLPHTVDLIDFAEQSSPEHRAAQPFGQVPVIREDGFSLFESGSIVLHVAEKSEALLPRDPAERARAVTWLFCALNTIEVVVQQLGEIDLFFSKEDWAKARRPLVEERVRLRLGELSTWLGDREYLEDRFTV